MSIFVDARQFQDINLGPVLQQFQILNVQVPKAQDHIKQLETATQSLNNNGMNALSGTLGSVQGLFESLGVELGRVPNRILNVATATTRLIGSMQKLNELKVTSEIKGAFAEGWKDAGKQAENFGNSLKNLGPKISGFFKDAGPNFTQLKGKLIGAGAATKNATTQTASLVVANQANTVAMTGAGVQATVLTAKNKKLGFSFAALKKKLTLKNILLGASTVVMALLNVVKGIFITLWKLSPFGMIAGAAALAVVGIRALVDWLNQACETTQYWKDRNEETAESLDALNGRLAESKEAHQDNLRAIQISEDANNRLIRKIQELQSEENLSEEQRRRLHVYTEQLNDSMEGYNLTIDESTGFLDENSAALLDQVDLYHDINAEVARSEEYQSRLNDKIRQQAEVGVYIDDLRKKRIEMVEQLGEESDAVIELDEKISGLEETYGDMGDTIVELADTAYESYARITNMTTELVAQQELTWDHLNEHQQSVMTDLKTMLTDYTDHAQNRMSTLCDDVTVTGREMIDNMIENQRVMADWSDNIAILAKRGIDEGLLEEMRQMGPEGAAQVAAMVDMTQDELDEMSEVHRNGAQVAADAMATQMGEGYEHAVNMASHFVQDSRTTLTNDIQQADFGSIGAKIPEGAAKGIARATSEYTCSISDMAEDGNNAFTDAIDSNSPSRLYMRYGGYIVEGLCNGIERMKPQAVRAIQGVAQNMQRVYSNANRDYMNIGQNVMTGLNQGLLSGENSVMSTARRIANNIARTMRQALDINSPSRVMREQIGRFIPEGIAAGIDKYAGAAIDSVYKLSDELINLNLPSVESMIGMGPSMGLAGVNGVASHVTHDHYTVNNEGLFNGATINWSGEEDIRRTMEKIAWATAREKARMW